MDSGGWKRRFRRRDDRRKALGAAVMVVAGVAVTILAGYSMRQPSAPTPSSADLAPLPSATVAEPKRYNTVFMGDSVTQADTPSFDDDPGPASWVAYTIGNDRTPWIYRANVAVAGQTTQQMADRFGHDVLRRKPEGVVILGGTNDMLTGVPTGTTIANLRSMVDAAKRAGARVWVASLPPSDEKPTDARVLHDAERAYAADAGVPFLDSYKALATDAGTYRKGFTTDGRHPTPEAASNLADSLVAQAAKAARKG